MLFISKPFKDGALLNGTIIYLAWTIPVNFELPDITNALEVNNTLSSYVIIKLLREKSL